MTGQDIDEFSHQVGEVERECTLFRFQIRVDEDQCA